MSLPLVSWAHGGFGSYSYWLQTYVYFWCLFFFNWWNLSWVAFPSLKAFIILCFDSHFDGHWRRLWWVACAAALWSIWLVRNAAIIEKKFCSIDELIFLAEVRSLFWIKTIKDDLIFCWNSLAGFTFCLGLYSERKIYFWWNVLVTTYCWFFEV